jgi:hypothetical protein
MAGTREPLAETSRPRNRRGDHTETEKAKLAAAAAQKESEVQKRRVPSADGRAGEAG